MSADARTLINRSPMHPLQVVVVLITVGLNALDGFDIASISFASPGISEEWGVSRGALGIVLSMELIGMCVGSILLGGFADKYGRRPTILGCLVVMAFGMMLATTSKSVIDLSIWRIVTGLGIGGMLAATNAVAAEFSNDARRHFFVSLMVIGYPIGIFVGGAIIRPLLADYNWRTIFYFGAFATALFIPLVYFFVPESIHWLARKQPVNALERINKTLQRFKFTPVDSVPVLTEEAQKHSLSELFKGGLLFTTIAVTAAYFFHITTFYFIIKWTPQIVADMGFPPVTAGSVLNWSTVGGALGGALFGSLTFKFGLKPLTLVVLALSVITIIAFGNSPKDIVILSVLAAIGGFTTNAGVVGLYTIFAHVFPTHLRAFGTGFAIGVGRGGAALSPIIAGFLFEAGKGLAVVATVMALGSLLAAIVLVFLKLRAAVETD
ncbi:MFS transporter [Aurantivibrio plasticivorans]